MTSQGIRPVRAMRRSPPRSGMRRPPNPAGSALDPAGPLCREPPARADGPAIDAVAQPDRRPPTATVLPFARRRSPRPHRRCPQAGRIGQHDRHAGQADRDIDMVPRGSRDIRYDCPFIPVIALKDLIFQRSEARRPRPARHPSTVRSAAAPANPQSPPSGHNRALATGRAARPLRHSRSRARPAPTKRASCSCHAAICLLQSAFGQGQRGLALHFGLRLEQVGQPFRFGQVDPAVLERAPGEFTGLRLPQSSMPAEPASTASTTARPPWH